MQRDFAIDSHISAFTTLASFSQISISQGLQLNFSLWHCHHALRLKVQLLCYMGISFETLHIYLINFSNHYARFLRIHCNSNAFSIFSNTMSFAKAFC